MNEENLIKERTSEKNIISFISKVKIELKAGKYKEFKILLKKIKKREKIDFDFETEKIFEEKKYLVDEFKNFVPLNLLKRKRDEENEDEDEENIKKKRKVKENDEIESKKLYECKCCCRDSNSLYVCKKCGSIVCKKCLSNSKSTTNLCIYCRNDLEVIKLNT